MVKSDYLKSVVAVTGGAAPFGPALIEKFMEKCAPNVVKFREGKVYLGLVSIYSFLAQILFYDIRFRDD